MFSRIKKIFSKKKSSSSSLKTPPTPIAKIAEPVVVPVPVKEIEVIEEEEEKIIPRPELPVIQKIECKLCGLIFLPDSCISFNMCDHTFCLRCISPFYREKKPELPCPCKSCDALMLTKELKKHIKTLKVMMASPEDERREGGGRGGGRGKHAPGAIDIQEAMLAGELYEDY